MSLFLSDILDTASGAEGEAGETADCSGRPVPGQRGETERAGETQGGGERKNKEGGRGGSQVSLREHVTLSVFEGVCMQ